MFDVEMSWNGATLTERLAHVSGSNSSAASADASRSSVPGGEVLARWAQACAFGSVDALFRRLSWDGIDPETARAAMAGEAPADFPVAAWIERIPELVAEARTSASLIGTPEWEAELKDVGLELPFVDVWLPVLRLARRRAAQTVPTCNEWLSEEAIRALEVHLLREISRLGELALLEDFRAHSEASAGADEYESYIRRLLASRYAEVLTTLPVLARHVVMLADQWIDQIRTLVLRLRHDQTAIAARFGDAGRVRRLTPGLSDRHGDAGRVTAVELSSGLRLAYKPRHVRLERAFNECLRWLRESGLDAIPPPLRVIDCGAYGWVEWVEQDDLDSREAVRAYFRSAGALACLTYVLGGTDLHSENLVASSRGPVLVDTEMLLQPSLRPLSEVSTEDEVNQRFDSCLASGLVSFVTVDKNGSTFDVGGLQPSTARELTVPKRRWLDLRSANIRFVPERLSHPVLRNDVRLHGEVQRPNDFVTEICDGFASTYRFLELNRAALLSASGPFAGFADCQIRVLFRPTDDYSKAQFVLAAPRFQRCGLDRSLGIETFARVFASELERPRLWPLVHDGRPALEALDIPRPTMRATAIDLEASTGEVVQSLYAHSGVDAMHRRVNALGANDLAYQIDQLRTALGDADTPGGASQGGATDDALHAAAERIGLALLGRAQHGSNGSIWWASSADRVELYSGASGIGLFFAALAAATKRDTWRDAAQRVMRTIETRARGTADSHEWRLGACNGQPSVAYAMALSGYLVEDEGLIARASDLAAALPSGAIDSDLALDIEGGAAGALVALLAVHELTGDSRLTDAARRCASRLLATQIRSGRDRGAWMAGEGPALPGFAHGAAGIAYALCRWAARAPDADVRDAVREAWAYERRLFAEHKGVWPTLRRDGSRFVMTAWCHGAPGIALARALAPTALADANVAAEIDAAMHKTLAAPESRQDHLCCGNLGRADVALTVGHRTGREAWTEAGMSMIKTAATRILNQGRLGMRARGSHWGAPAPELFQGVAGIGYQLLRASSPANLPSVLAFEVPSVIRQRYESGR